MTQSPEGRGRNWEHRRRQRASRVGRTPRPLKQETERSAQLCTGGGQAPGLSHLPSPFPDGGGGRQPAANCRVRAEDKLEASGEGVGWLPATSPLLLLLSTDKAL